MMRPLKCGKRDVNIIVVAAKVRKIYK